MSASFSDIVVGCIVVGTALVAIPAFFFLITFLPGLMRTTGELIGATNRQRQASSHLSSNAQPPRANKSFAEKS